MENEMEKDLGIVDISEDVIGSIASLAALEVEGVVEMARGLSKELAAKFGKKSSSKGIKITKEDNEITVDVNIVVLYGEQIQDIAYNVQNQIKNSIEVMTGFNVVKVNINIEGVQLKAQ